MRASVMAKKLEPNSVERTFTLILPTEKGRKKIYLREWILLQLVHLGYETVGVENFVFGRFPERVTVRPYVDETEEMRASLNNFLKEVGVKFEGSSLEVME